MDLKQTRNLLKIHSLVSVVTTIKQGSQFRTGGHFGLAKKGFWYRLIPMYRFGFTAILLLN